MKNLLIGAAVAVAMTALPGCASNHADHARLSAGLSADMSAMFAELPAIVARPVVSDFDEMRLALPAFSLERGHMHDINYGDVSVVRDISFPVDKDILSDSEVARIELLKSYLRTHSTVTVRIEGYGDGAGLSERDTELSMARAQAVKRALLTDIMLSNTINCIGGVKARPVRRNGSVEIIFVRPSA